MIDLYNFPILSECRTDLRETSIDDSDSNDIKYMTESKLEAVNFDQVKRKYVNRLNLSEDCAKSMDAVVQKDGRIIFIEFKNGKVNNRDIKDKLRDSLLIFLDIVKKDLDYARTNVDCVVVYNQFKNPISVQSGKNYVQESRSRDIINDFIAGKADTEIIRFDLERYKRLYYRQVHTYPIDRFEKYLEMF